MKYLFLLTTLCATAAVTAAPSDHSRDAADGAALLAYAATRTAAPAPYTPAPTPDPDGDPVTPHTPATMVAPDLIHECATDGRLVDLVAMTQAPAQCTPETCGPAAQRVAVSAGPVRKVVRRGFGFVRDRRPVRRLLTLPFRLLRCRRC